MMKKGDKVIVLSKSYGYITKVLSDIIEVHYNK